MADGSAVKLADAGAGTTEWQLAYEGLTDAEAERLGAFFAAVEGTLNGFTFLDPVGNLLAWSGQLENAVWNKGPLLAVSATEGGWRLANAGRRCAEPHADAGRAGRLHVLPKCVRARGIGRGGDAAAECGAFGAACGHRVDTVDLGRQRTGGGRDDHLRDRTAGGRRRGGLRASGGGAGGRFGIQGLRRARASTRARDSAMGV